MKKMKKFKITVTDETGEVVKSFDLVKSNPDAKRNLNDFILEALLVSEDKRELPFIIQCPNGLEVHPKLKMKFENFGSPLLGDKLESMCVTWRD